MAIMGWTQTSGDTDSETGQDAGRNFAGLP